MTEIVIITGTRKGIGRYLAEYYIDKGYFVVGCSRSDIDKPLENYQHYCLDVADEKAVQNMVHKVVKEHGQIHILLNNAGIASMNHILLTPLSTVKRIFETNFYGTFLFAREVAKTMVRHKYGRIVNFATVAAPLKLEGEAAYAASKAAVANFTQVMAKEVAAYNITVNALGPTPVATDLIRGVDDAKMQGLINTQAIKRLGTFEDISNVTDFFIRRESDFITGQTVYLGGIS